MKLRLAKPSMLVDIGRLTDLSYIRDAGDHIAIGALTRHMDVEKSTVLAEHVPLLANAASYVGDAQVRHRGGAWRGGPLPPGTGGTRPDQRARCHPLGLVGRLYWYTLLPFHRFVFGPMAARIAERAETSELDPVARFRA